MPAKRDEIEALATTRLRVPIFEAFVERQLSALGENDPNAPTVLYTYYVNRFNVLKHKYLFPHPAADEPPPASMPGVNEPEPQLPTIIRNPSRNLQEMERRWIQLRDELRYIAEYMWRQFFAQPALDDSILRKMRRHRRLATDVMEMRDPALRSLFIDLEFYTYQARSLLLLWLEVELYFYRAISNYEFYNHHIGREGTMMRRFRVQLQTYMNLRHEWDGALGIQLFYAQEGDAERLKALSKEFGPARLGNEEPGWITEASAVSDELRYLYFDEALRERRKQHRWGAAAWLTALKWTLGYGVKPVRFLWSLIWLIVFFTFALTLNDVVPTMLGNTCVPVSSFDTSLAPSSWLGLVSGHLGVALYDLTGRGGNGSNCGVAGLLETLEAVLSYFFLATLAAFFIEQLVDVER